MPSLDELALAIDAATDAGDAELLRQLAVECESLLSNAEGEDRVLLRYFQSNSFSGIIESMRGDADYHQNWEQPDGIRNILALRQAIREPAFQSIDPCRRCQIRTNLANRLDALGRPVAANEHRHKVLQQAPGLAKALVGQAKGLIGLARMIYDEGQKPFLLAAARDRFDAALDENASWESGDRESIAPGLKAQRERIDKMLSQGDYDKEFDRNRWSLGTTKDERAYRRWCLHERLFLNPLNEAYTDSVAATDVLHLPSHTYKISETPRFPAYYNLMKQEYVSARYRLYRAIHGDEPEFAMRDTHLLDSGEGQVLGHLTEELRAAFRSAYSIFDKIGLFLNDYFQIGMRPRQVNFRSVWTEQQNSAVCEIRLMFKDQRNLPLRGLYALSKDLYDEAFAEVAEPDAADLAQLRHQAEHRFLSFQEYEYGEGTEIHRLIPIDDFEKKALRLLKLAREALIYVSLAMHAQEALREEAQEGNEKVLGMPIYPQRIPTFDQP